jgi:phage/plasmid-like protein (TIGR03299 family)
MCVESTRDANWQCHMPDQLSESAGKVEMMYVGEEPWHGLGQRLEKAATSAEAIEAAHLNWEVIKIPLFTKQRRTYRNILDKFAVARADKFSSGDTTVLGIVGAGYNLLQNRDAFAWFDGIVGEGKAIYHTAGALGDGERVWILAKLPGEIKVIGDDVVNKFLLLSNSHDGESSVQVKFTPIRVACSNTLTMALRRGPTLRISHTASLTQRMEQAKQNLGIITTRYEQIQNDFAALGKVFLNQNRLQEFLTSVFPDPEDVADERGRRRASEARSNCAIFFETGRGNDMPRVRGTLWAAYNGVTEYIDHQKVKADRSKHLHSIWFGDGYLTKARAFRAAIERARQWHS